MWNCAFKYHHPIRWKIIQSASVVVLCHLCSVSSDPNRKQSHDSSLGGNDEAGQINCSASNHTWDLWLTCLSRSNWSDPRSAAPWLPVCLSVYRSVCLPVYLSICLCVCLPAHCRCKWTERAEWGCNCSLKRRCVCVNRFRCVTELPADSEVWSCHMMDAVSLSSSLIRSRNVSYASYANTTAHLWHAASLLLHTHTRLSSAPDSHQFIIWSVSVHLQSFLVRVSYSEYTYMYWFLYILSASCYLHFIFIVLVKI